LLGALGMLCIFGFLSLFLYVTAMPASADAAETELTPAAHIEALRRSPQYRSALAIVSRDHGRLNAENIKLTEIPAPPFKEEAKAKVFRDMLREGGLSNVELDAEGNVLALRRGTGNGPLLAVAAHVDTVFPEGTDVKVKRDGNKLRAPGIADDTRGLAALLAIVRAMDEAKIETESDILFVGSVGEEGLGDLRGAKHLFLKGPYKGKIEAFIALDGIRAERVVTTAVGSRRYRVTFAGPGGCRWLARVWPYRAPTLRPWCRPRRTAQRRRFGFPRGRTGRGEQGRTIPPFWYPAALRVNAMQICAVVEGGQKGLANDP
jgi:tripeptide aminopeptidase